MRTFLMRGPQRSPYINGCTLSRYRSKDIEDTITRMPFNLRTAVLIGVFLCLTVALCYPGNLTDLLYDRPITVQDPETETTLTPFSRLAALIILLSYAQVIAWWTSILARLIHEFRPQ